MAIIRRGVEGIKAVIFCIATIGRLFRIKTILLIFVLFFSCAFIFIPNQSWNSNSAFIFELSRCFPSINLNINCSVDELALKNKNNNYSFGIEQQYNTKKLKTFLYPEPKTFIDLKIRYLVNNDVCSTFPVTEEGEREKTKDILILNLLVSHPGNSKLRSVIRSTFPKSELERLGIRRLFLLARPNKLGKNRSKFDKGYRQPKFKELLLENDEHGDLLIGDFLDNYKNLTYKSLMGLDWATKYCPRATFVLKSDDDTLVDLYQLTLLLKNNAAGSKPNFEAEAPIEFSGDETHDHTLKLYSKIRQKLTSNSSDRRYVIGSMEARWVIREPSSKFFVSLKEYAPTYFPPYADGKAYFMTMEAAIDMLPKMNSVPFFWLEDVYITGFLREKAQIDFLNVIDLYNLDRGFFKCCSRHSLSNSSDLDLQLDKALKILDKMETGSKWRTKSTYNFNFNVLNETAFLQPQWCSTLFGKAEKNDIYQKFHQHAKFCFDSHLCTRRPKPEQMALCNGLVSSSNNKNKKNSGHDNSSSKKKTKAKDKTKKTIKNQPTKKKKKGG